MSRAIDHHDVHAFCERAREAIDALEKSAKNATQAGWSAEARDYELLATRQKQRAVAALDDLMDCLGFTLDGQASREASAADELLGPEH